MIKINYVLPYPEVEYLESLAELLAGISDVILITGIQTESGEIKECQLVVRESTPTFNLGILMGRHLENYSLQIEAIEGEEAAFREQMIERSDEEAAAILEKIYEEEKEGFSSKQEKLVEEELPVKELEGRVLKLLASLLERKFKK